MKEMQESGTFNSLIEANGRENAKKSKFHDILIRSELTSVFFCLTAQSQSPFPLSKCYKREVNKNKQTKALNQDMERMPLFQLKLSWLLYKWHFFPVGREITDGTDINQTGELPELGPQWTPVSALMQMLLRNQLKHNVM